MESLKTRKKLEEFPVFPGAEVEGISLKELKFFEMFFSDQKYVKLSLQKIGFM